LDVWFSRILLGFVLARKMTQVSVFFALGHLGILTVHMCMGFYISGERSYNNTSTFTSTAADLDSKAAVFF